MPTITDGFNEAAEGKIEEALARSKSLTYEEIAAGVKNKAIQLLDVRTPDEIADRGSISDSDYNIPVQELQAALSLPDDEFEKKYNFKKSELESVVCYCRAGKKCKTALAELCDAGFKDVKIFPGSYDEWSSKKQ